MSLGLWQSECRKSDKWPSRPAGAKTTTKKWWWMHSSYFVDWLVLVAMWVPLTVALGFLKPRDKRPYIHPVPIPRFDTPSLTSSPVLPPSTIPASLYTADNVFTLPTATTLSVPTFLPPVISVVLLLLSIGLSYRYYKSSHDIHNGILGVCEAFTLSMSIQVPASRFTGYFRPDYYARIVSGATTDIQDGRLAFPSLHSTLTYTGFVYLSLYWAAKFRVFYVFGGQLPRLVLSFVPIWLAVYISLTTIADNYSHPVDVLAGAACGITGAFVGYYLNYPAMSSAFGYLPKLRIAPKPTTGSRAYRNNGPLPRIRQQQEEEEEYEGAYERIELAGPALTKKSKRGNNNDNCEASGSGSVYSTTPNQPTTVLIEDSTEMASSTGLYLSNQTSPFTDTSGGETPTWYNQHEQQHHMIDVGDPESPSLHQLISQYHSSDEEGAPDGLFPVSPITPRNSSETRPQTSSGQYDNTLPVAHNNPPQVVQRPGPYPVREYVHTPTPPLTPRCQSDPILPSAPRSTPMPTSPLRGILKGQDIHYTHPTYTQHHDDPPSLVFHHTPLHDTHTYATLPNNADQPLYTITARLSDNNVDNPYSSPSRQ